MINFVSQCAVSAGKFGLAGATFGLPFALLGPRSDWKENAVVASIAGIIAGMAFGALRHAFSSMVALGSLALCVTALASGARPFEFLVLIPGALVTGGGIGYVTEIALKTALVYSNLLTVLFSIAGAACTLIYHSGRRNGRIDWKDAVDTTSAAFIGGAAGYILDFSLKAIKA